MSLGNALMGSDGMVKPKKRNVGRKQWSGVEKR